MLQRTHCELLQLKLLLDCCSRLACYSHVAARQFIEHVTVQSDRFDQPLLHLVE